MKTVIEMAQQTLNRDRLGFWAAGMGDLEAFVALVRADEREACAEAVRFADNGTEAAEIIRARGNVT